MSRTVTVTGHGSASAVPDTAVVRVAAVHRAAGDGRGALGRRVGPRRRRRGGRETSSSPRPTSASGRPTTTRVGGPGFEARHALSITGGDLEAAGALVGRLAEEVGDRLQVESVSLSVGDPTAALTEAREAAFAEARARAEHLAGLAGATLGEVQDVAEGAGAARRPRQSEAFAMKADVGFAPGQTQLTSTVTVTWALA